MSTFRKKQLKKKVGNLKDAYNKTCEAFNYLNNTELTQNIIWAKEQLLKVADSIDKANKQSNFDEMNKYIGDVFGELHSALNFSIQDYLDVF